MTTTPESVTTNPALGLPSEPLPVSPTTAYTPGARGRSVGCPAPGVATHAREHAHRPAHQPYFRGATNRSLRREPLGRSGRTASGGCETDIDRLLERGALVVGPHHRQRRLLLGLEREAHDGIPTDAGC